MNNQTLDQNLKKVPVAVRQTVLEADPAMREKLLRIYKQNPDRRGYRGEIRCLPPERVARRRPIRHAI